MDIRPRRTDNPVARFWDRYIESIHNQGIKPPADRWYVRRSEQYITCYADKKLAAHTPTDVKDYLENLGRDASITDWQLVLAVDAIRNLFRLAREGPLSASRYAKGGSNDTLTASALPARRRSCSDRCVRLFGGKKKPG